MKYCIWLSHLDILIFNYCQLLNGTSSDTPATSPTPSFQTGNKTLKWNKYSARNYYCNYSAQQPALLSVAPTGTANPLVILVTVQMKKSLPTDNSSSKCYHPKSSHCIYSTLPVFDWLHQYFLNTSTILTHFRGKEHEQPKWCWDKHQTTLSQQLSSFHLGCGASEPEWLFYSLHTEKKEDDAAEFCVCSKQWHMFKT